MKLKGKSQKGKNRIRELGENWTIVQQRDSVAFSQLKGPWLMVEPNAGSDHARWINKMNDPDFEIVNS